MSSEEITEAVKFRVKPNESAPNRPIAKQIEDGGDFKGLLTDGIEMEEGNLARQWSLWRQTDPVALFKGVVLKGDPSFAADYANNVFVFANEENMKEFLATPKKFLQNAPEMPPNYRMMIFGPSGSGVDYQAQELSKFYGWKIIDFDKIVRTKLAMVMELADKPPNNVRNDGPCMVSLSQEELDLIKEGKKFESWKFIPWILEFMGIPLAQRPPPPPPAPINEEDLDEAALADYKKKQAKEAKELAIKQKAEEEEAKANADYDE
jgi:YHS domain-containing protein